MTSGKKAVPRGSLILRPRHLRWLIEDNRTPLVSMSALQSGDFPGASEREIAESLIETGCPIHGAASS